MHANARGLQTFGPDLQQLLAEHEPHIVFVSELKANKKQCSKGWIRKCMPGFKICASGMPDDTSAGVLVAVRKEIATCGDARSHTFSDTRLWGRLAGMTMRLPGSQPLHLLGVYAHASQADAPARAHLYEAIAAEVAEATAAGGVCLIGGDWNATLFGEDRCTCGQSNSTSVDQAHRAFIASHGLATLDPSPAPRIPSFYRDPADPASTKSRIDDVFVAGAPSCLPRAKVQSLGQLPTSDHEPLLFTIDAADLGEIPPRPRRATHSPSQ
jgi:exonuclease III